jgi:hypothetical protein
MATTSTAVTFVEAPTKDDMPVVCCECGATIREGTQGPVSHGLCPQCFAWAMVEAGFGREVAPPDVYEVMGRLARALQERRGWDVDRVCIVMDGICYGAKRRVEAECEVMWLAHEEGLLDVVGSESAATTEPVSMPLAAPAA